MQLFKKLKPRESSSAEEAPRLPNLFWALVPILSMVGLMLYVFGFVADSETYDAAHMPLLCSTVVACAVGMAYSCSFKYMLEGILNRLLVSMDPIPTCSARRRRGSLLTAPKRCASLPWPTWRKPEKKDAHPVRSNGSPNPKPA